ncbi:MAG: dTDP-4-dehydrorhamnose 3,5-epimerase, partial [Acidobacteria bacterium]
AIYLPKGFAHGFKTLTDEAIVAYKINALYHPASASGIFWKDPDLAIKWNEEHPVISDRDAALQNFSDFISPFD